MDMTVTLTPAQIATLVEALDCYEYWELGQDLPRNDGAVFLPGDSFDPTDPYWLTAPTAEESQAIEAIKRTSALAHRMSRLVSG